MNCNSQGCFHTCQCECDPAEKMDRIWRLTDNAMTCAGFIPDGPESESFEWVGATDEQFWEWQEKHMHARLGRCDGECRQMALL